MQGLLFFMYLYVSWWCSWAGLKETVTQAWRGPTHAERYKPSLASLEPNHLEYKPAKVCLSLTSISLNFWSLLMSPSTFRKWGSKSRGREPSVLLKSMQMGERWTTPWMQSYLFAFCSHSHKLEDFPFSWFFSTCPVFLCYAPVSQTS